MDGDAGVVDASMTELVLNSALSNVADFGELLRASVRGRAAVRGDVAGNRR